MFKLCTVSQILEQCSGVMHQLLSFLPTFLSILPYDYKKTFKILVSEEDMSGNGVSKTFVKFERLHSCSVVFVPVQGQKPLLVSLFNQGTCSKKLVTDDEILKGIILISDILF